MLSLTYDPKPVKAAPPFPIFSGPEQRRRELLDAWLAGRAPTTVKAYGADLRDFAAFLGQPGATDAVQWLFSQQQGDANYVVMRYRAHLLEQGLSTATVARRISALRSLGLLARQLGACIWTLDVAVPKVEGYRDTAGPGAAGWSKIREAATRDDSPRGRRDRAIVMMARNMALRRAEVASLRVEDLDLNEGAPVGAWVMRKGKTERKWLAIPGHTGAALRAWLEVRGSEEGPVFFRMDKAAPMAQERAPLTGQAIADLVARLGAAAGLNRKVKPHGLRHEGVTAAWEATQDVMDTMDFAGHASFNTTKKYIDNAKNRAGRVAQLIEGE